MTQIINKNVIENPFIIEKEDNKKERYKRNENETNIIYNSI